MTKRPAKKRKPAPVQPSKDETRERPVAIAWRAPLTAVVRALARRDYALKQRVEGVASPTKSTVAQMRNYVASYGEELVELPAKAWSTSVAMWTGTLWEVFVDLWTRPSGRSDMVLYVHVRERDGGYRFTLQSIHVP